MLQLGPFYFNETGVEESFRGGYFTAQSSSLRLVTPVASRRNVEQ